MGAALWIAAGAVAFLAARAVPVRKGRWWPELLVALAAALALGALATALDFGGWREPDWRAGTFCLVGSFAIAGAVRAFRP